MALDWNSVEGYREDMTAEEKLALLDNWNPPEPKPADPTDPPAEPKPSPAKGGVVSKGQFDKVSSELAALKKQLRSRMSEDEQKELDRQAKTAEMETELNELRHEKMVASYKASYLAQGYDETLAEQAANAMADGDNDTVFETMKKHQANMEKAMRAKLLKETPVPPASEPPKEEDKDKKMLDIIRQSMGLPPTKK